jgi:hypothetical protein
VVKLHAPPPPTIPVVVRVVWVCRRVTPRSYAFVNTMQGVNAAAIRKGFVDLGVKDNEVLVFSKLKDAKSLFLTSVGLWR